MGKTIATIYGIITDSFYDDPWFEQEIKNGSITPSSRFIYQVASATGDLEVHVNSFGGDVFAANSMIIALRAWKANHPDAQLDIIIESIALSAAANFVAMAPKSAKVHAYGPSLIMFHSCSTVTFGGPGAHKDAATLMEKINESVKSTLKSKTSLSDADIDVWFQDDRQGWLTAQEAKDCKLIDDMLDGEPMPAPAEPTEKLEDKAVAAFYSGQHSLLALHINQQGDMTMPTAEEDENKNKEEEEKKDNPEQQGSDDDKKDDTPEQTDDGEEGKKDDDSEKKDDGEEGKKDDDSEKKDDGEEGKKDDDPEQAGKEVLAKLEARVAELSKENADLKQQLSTANETVAKLTKGLNMKGGGAPTASAPKTFNDLVKAIDPNLPSQEWRKQYLQLKHDHQDLFEQTYNMPSQADPIH